MTVNTLAGGHAQDWRSAVGPMAISGELVLDGGHVFGAGYFATSVALMTARAGHRPWFGFA